MSKVAFDSIAKGPDFNSRKALRDVKTVDDLKNIDPTEYQEIENLARSIDLHGLMQPPVVREGGASRTTGGRSNFLVAGERRYWAIALLRHARVKGKMSRTTAAWANIEVTFVKGDKQTLKAKNIVENLQRKDLEPLEEAQAIRAYMDDFKVSQTVAAHDLNVSEPFISQRLSLLKKTAPEVQKAIEDGTITATHAREMLTLPKEKQVEILDKVTAKVADGKTVKVSDIHEMAEAEKEKQGIRRTRKRKNAPEYNEDKVKAAKDKYNGDASLKPLRAIQEGLGDLLGRIDRATTDDARAALKAKLDALEWAVGYRERL